LKYLTHKIVSKPSDPDLDFVPIPDPGSKDQKAPDPGSATLKRCLGTVPERPGERGEKPVSSARAAPGEGGNCRLIGTEERKARMMSWSDWVRVVRAGGLFMPSCPSFIAIYRNNKICLLYNMNMVRSTASM
jgi:hypothetical protein